MKKLTFLIFFYCLQISVFSQEFDRFKDSLNSKLESKVINEQIDILLNTSQKYTSSAFNKSIYCSNKVIELTDENTFTSERAQSFYNIGEANYYIGEIKVAIENYFKAHKLFSKLGDSVNLADTKNNIGLSYYYLGMYAEALQVYLDNIDIEQIIHYEKGLAMTLHNIGLIYYNLKNYPMALIYYKKAVKIYKRVDKKDGIAAIYQNIGIIKKQSGKLNEAIEYYQKSLAIYEATNDAISIAISYNNIGLLYKELGRFKKAIHSIQNSYESFQKVGYKNGCSTALLNLGEIYLDNNNIKKAHFYLNRALQLSYEISFLENVYEAYKMLSQVCEKEKKTDSALFYYKLFTEIKDSILNSETKIEINELQKKYESEKKQKEIINLENKAKIQDIQLARKSSVNRILITSIIIVIILLIIILLILKKIKKTNQSLHKSKNLLSQQKASLLKINKELTMAKSNAEQASKSKGIFLANMSHEFRTPMNSIIGYTNILIKEPKHKKIGNYLQNIKIACNNLLCLVNDILDYSKIEAGKMVVDYQEFKLSELFTRINETFSIAADNKKIKFSTEYNSIIPEFVVGDELKLNQILTNLLSNAIKFTNEGGTVQLFVSSEKVDSHQIKLTCKVKDTGIGMDEEIIKNIFNEFSQGNSSTNKKYGGTGLGLSIVKKLVEIQNGNIKVTSQPNKGSEFTISLILNELASISEENNNSLDQSVLIEQKIKLLIAEDIKANQEVIIDLIHAYDIKANIDTVENGLEVMANLKQNKYDLILMDIQMPFMDGIETIEHIRHSAKFNDIPVIALTAYAYKNEKEKILNAGFNDIITKPFDPELLLKKIAFYLNKYKSELSSVQFAKSNFVPNENLLNNQFKYIDLNYLIKNYKGNIDGIRKILTLYSESISKDIAKLEANTKQGNTKIVTNIAHKLKSQFKYIGFKINTDNSCFTDDLKLHADNIQKLTEIILKIKEKWRYANTEIKEFLSIKV